MEVGARGQTRTVLQERAEQFLGGAGIGGRLQDDGGPGAQIAAEGDRRLLDVPQVGSALVQRGRHGHHRDVEPAAVAGRFARSVGAVVQRRADPLGGDVLDEGLTGGQALDPPGVDVVADHLVTDLGGADGQRQPDVSLSHHDDTHQ
ncbi:hypothetical protein QF037_001545 [Streptomyces canus]|nr:hypothetical protein [Streptomyces canus]